MPIYCNFKWKMQSQGPVFFQAEELFPALVSSIIIVPARKMKATQRGAQHYERGSGQHDPRIPNLAQSQFPLWKYYSEHP